MKYLKLIVALLLISTVSCRPNLGPNIKEISNKGTHLEVSVKEGTYLIKPYSTEIIETSFIPEGELFEAASHAVVMEPQDVKTVLTYNQNSIKYATDGLSVQITKNPFHIEYRYKNDFIISEKEGYIQNDSVEKIRFNLDSTEILYGGGARALGMNRRGHRLELYNKAHYGYEARSELMNYTLPIVMSSKKYMLHFDNAPIGYLDLDSKKDNTLTYETISGRKTYQVIVGETWFDLVDNYTDLTGKQPLPPRWALGNFSSRFGYHSQAETERAVQAFRDEKIPVDAVILDLYWFGKPIQGTLGNFEFLKDSFPDPEKMIADFNKKGIKTILITEPFVLETSKKWQEAIDKKILATDSLDMPHIFEFYFGKGGIIDIYKEHGYQWFWDIYKKYTDLGVAGWWGDLGEPEAHPSYVQHAVGSADEVHNIYGHDWARLVFEGYKRDFPEQRPFILMRAGAAGSQRFGLIPWSGDVNRSWGGLQSQPEIALQMGMQGLGYMHSDLGGFAGANLDNELYTRWLQYGVFQPIYRPHAQEEVPSEPVYREIATKALAKRSIELRYQLLPYNYTLLFENNQTGAPLMRPLFFNEENNQKLLSSSTTYLWGDNFLVTPILKPSVKVKEMYFPNDAVWFDFYTNERIAGGQSKVVSTNQYSIPTYVRAGAFIPMAKPMQNMSTYDTNVFDIHYYHDRTVNSSRGKLYNDDGVTPYAFEKGAYEIIYLNSTIENNELKINLKTELGSDFLASDKELNIIIHNVESSPSQVLYDSQKADFLFDENTNKLMISIRYVTSNTSTINITL